MLAILYDVHGNLPALEAVLEDAGGQGADAWLIGGDVAAFGTWPLECVGRLRGLGAQAAWIRGNLERWQARPGEALDNPVVAGANAYVRDALGPDLVAELGALPGAVRRGATLFCHASPGSDMEPVPREADAEAEAALLEGVEARRVVFGHTHVQFARTSADGRVELVNAGSGACPGAATSGRPTRRWTRRPTRWPCAAWPTTSTRPPARWTPSTRRGRPPRRPACGPRASTSEGTENPQAPRSPFSSHMGRKGDRGRKGPGRLRS